MVLESLFSPRNIINKPLDILILSFIVTLVCIYISHYIFPEYSGVISPLLVTVTFAPLIYRIFCISEDIEDKQAKKQIKLSFFERHGETLTIFSLFFLGCYVAIFLVACIAPEEFVTTSFAAQIKEIETIRGMSGQITGSAFSREDFTVMIMTNNLRVMIFSFLLSFLVGTGAVFILAWNASILAIFLAGFIRQGLLEQFVTYSIGIFPHAVIEMGAYFLAGIAGGILSVGVIREKIHGKEFGLIFRDSLLLLLLGIIAVVFGAFVEVYL